MPMEKENNTKRTSRGLLSQGWLLSTQTGPKKILHESTFSEMVSGEPMRKAQSLVMNEHPGFFSTYFTDKEGKSKSSP